MKMCCFGSDSIKIEMVAAMTSEARCLVDDNLLRIELGSILLKAQKVSPF